MVRRCSSLGVGVCHCTATRALRLPRLHSCGHGMLKLLTVKGLCCLLRREKEQHRDIDKYLLGEPLQERPEFRFPLEAVFALKIRIDNPDTDGHGTVSAPFNLCLGVDTFVFCKNVQDLLDLWVRLRTSIMSCHSYNRPS